VIVIFGLVILVAALIVGMAAVLANGGAGHGWAEHAAGRRAPHLPLRP
jgi:hypothetical protein